MVDEIYSTPAVKDVFPISGSLNFPESLSDKVLTLQSIQDLEEESSESFFVKLTSARGGATLSDVDSSAILIGKNFFPQKNTFGGHN